jgi:hypothetical protein
MALTIQGEIQQGVIPMGYSAKKIQHGQFAFNAQDANGELKVNMHRVEALILTPLGVVATDESVYVDENALAKDGGMVVPAGGTLTIARTGAVKTAGLKCSYIAIGT